MTPAMPRVALLFAGLHVLLMLALLVPISLHRRGKGIGLGSGGDALLERRIRVHGNFIEHVPFAILLLALLELTGLPTPWVWGFGSALLLARVMHAVGFSRRPGYSFGRFFGTALTWLLFLLMALAALWLALR